MWKPSPLIFSKREQALYDAVSQFKANSDGSKGSAFSTLTFQREACSSREAVFYTLKNMKEKYEQPSPDYLAKLDDLFSKVNETVQNSKAEKALELIKTLMTK